MSVRRVLVWALVTVAALCALAVVALPAWASQQLIDALNARVSGTVQLSLQPMWSQMPGVRVQAIRWRPSSDQAGEIDIGEIDVRSRWAADADVRPLNVRLRDVRVELHQLADGQWVLPRLVGDGGDGGDDGARAPFHLARVDIDTLRLRLHPHDAPVVEVDVAHVAVIADADRWRLVLSGDATRAALRGSGQVKATLARTDAGLRVDALEVEGQASQAAVSVPALSFAAASVQLSQAGGVEIGAARLDAEVHVAGEVDTVALRLAEARFEGGQLTARVDTLRLDRGGTVAAQLALNDMVVTADAAQVGVSPLQGKLSAQLPLGRVDVTASAGLLRYGLASRRAQLDGLQLIANAPDPANADARVDAHATVSAEFSVDPTRAQGTASVEVERSTLDARWSFDPADAKPLSIRATVDRLDLDRWLASTPASDEPAPLAAWRDWPLRADLQVGTLVWRGVRVKRAHLVLGPDEAAVAASAPSADN